MRINDLFADDDGEGFYKLPTLKFVLFEYEEHLRKVAKSTAAKIEWEGFHGAKNSVEHIYPQTPEVTEWPSFNAFSRREKLFKSFGSFPGYTGDKMHTSPSPRQIGPETRNPSRSILRSIRLVELETAARVRAP